MHSNLPDNTLKTKPVIVGNIKKSAFKDNRNSPSPDIKNSSANNAKTSIIMKKKKVKNTNYSVQQKEIVKFKMKPLYNNIISNLDSETLNLTSKDIHIFLLSCRFCRKDFETLENFKDHACLIKQSKSRTKTYGCKYCSLTFTQRNHLNRHVIGHMRNNCMVCNAQFAKRKALCKHLKSEHNITETKKLFSCAFCDKQFSKKLYLAEHLKVHADGQHICLKCGFMSDNEQIYKDHMKQHISDLKYKCELCEQKFVRRQQLTQHIAGHEKHSCSVCGVNFSTKKLLIKHKYSVHSTRIAVIKKYACSLCGRWFARPRQLQLHQRMHTGERPVKCFDCEKSFSDVRNLSRHKKSVKHLQRVSSSEGKRIDIEKPFQCSECGVCFFRQSSLLRHIEQIHSVKKSLKCPLCDYSTNNGTNLKRHQEGHADVRRFVCEMCGLCFRALATLKEHYAFVHSENRDFTCDICKKTFKNKSTLQRHIKVHSETRPFKCHCNKDYKRLSHLKRHMSSCHHMPFKKNPIPNIYEGVSQDTSSNDDAALIESLDKERKHSSPNDFLSFSICSLAVTDENSSQLLSEEVSTSDSHYIDVPLNTLPTFMDKNDPAAKPSLVNIPAPSAAVKAPGVNFQDDHALSLVALDDNNFNLSPSHFCNFNLSSSPIKMESVTATPHDTIGPQDVLTFSTPTDNLNQVHSLQNHPSSMDVFTNFSLNRSTVVPISSFLLGADMSSPTHMNDLNLTQVTTSKPFFGDSDDILSLSQYTSNTQFNGASCPTEQLFNSVRDIELWDTADNSIRLKLPGDEFSEGSCVLTQANNLQNLLFTNDSFHCSLDANSADFDVLSHLC